MKTRIGSLCTGYGGLEIAVGKVFPEARLDWVCENDPAASKVLAHQWPEVPNLGDIRKINWKEISPVDIITAGYPCQPFSRSGDRKGTDDERHLWPEVYRAICEVQPKYAFLENMQSHRSLGFEEVLADLAEKGLDTQWVSLRADDVRAPHARGRVFVLVTDPSVH